MKVLNSEIRINPEVYYPWAWLFMIHMEYQASFLQNKKKKKKKIEFHLLLLCD